MQLLPPITQHRLMRWGWCLVLLIPHAKGFQRHLGCPTGIWLPGAAPSVQSQPPWQYAGAGKVSAAPCPLPAAQNFETANQTWDLSSWGKVPLLCERVYCNSAPVMYSPCVYCRPWPGHVRDPAAHPPPAQLALDLNETPEVQLQLG